MHGFEHVSTLVPQTPDHQKDECLCTCGVDIQIVYDSCVKVCRHYGEDILECGDGGCVGGGGFVFGIHEAREQPHRHGA
jgi:hypothetical protein